MKQRVSVSIPQLYLWDPDMNFRFTERAKAINDEAIFVPVFIALPIITVLAPIPLARLSGKLSELYEISPGNKLLL